MNTDGHLFGWVRGRFPSASRGRTCFNFDVLRNGHKKLNLSDRGNEVECILFRQGVMSTSFSFDELRASSLGTGRTDSAKEFEILRLQPQNDLIA